MKTKVFARAAAFMCGHNGRKPTATIGIQPDPRERVRDEFDTDEWMSVADAKRLRKSLDQAIRYCEQHGRAKRC